MTHIVMAHVVIVHIVVVCVVVADIGMAYAAMACIAMANTYDYGPMSYNATEALFSTCGLLIGCTVNTTSIAHILMVL